MGMKTREGGFAIIFRKTNRKISILHWSVMNDIKYAKLNMFNYDIFLILNGFVNLCCCHCFCSPSDLGCPGNLSKLFSWWENTFVSLSFIGGCLLYCVTAGGACMCAWVVKQNSSVFYHVINEDACVFEMLWLVWSCVKKQRRLELINKRN